MFGWMLLVGVFEAIRSALLPAIRTDLGLSYSAVGVLLFISYWGFLLGSAVGGIATDRFGDKTIILLGALMALFAAFSFFTVRRYVMLVVVMLILRSGVGLLDIAISAHGGRIFVTRPTVKMNLLHLCFSVGATSAPIYASLLFVLGAEWQAAYGLLALPCLPLVLSVIMAPYHHPRKHQFQLKSTLKTLIGDRRVLWLMMLMGCAIIFEATVLEWSKNYLLELRGFTDQRSNLYLAIFYGGLTLGRLVNGLVCERLGELRTYLIYAMCIIVLFVLFQSFVALHFLFLILGWFMAPFFPIVMILAARYFPKMTGGSMGIILAVGGLMYSIFSLLVGVAHDLLGVQLGYATITLGMMVAIPVVLLLMSQEKKRAQ